MKVTGRPHRGSCNGVWRGEVNQNGLKREWEERNWEVSLDKSFLRKFTIKENREIEGYLEGNER